MARPREGFARFELRGRRSTFARSSIDFVAGAALSQGQVSISRQAQHFRKVLRPLSASWGMARCRKRWLKCSYFRDLGIWHTSHLTTQLVTLYSTPQSVKRSKGCCFVLFCLCRESQSVSSISGARVSPQGDFLQTTQKINNAYDFLSEVGASAGRLRTRYSGQLGVSAGCSRHGSR